MTIVAQFSIEFTQFLDSEGKATQPLPEFAKNPKTLLTLYHWMLFTRTFDAKAVALQRTGKMGTFPSSLGQEAISIGIGHAMKPEDVFVPYYRDQGTMFLRGVKAHEIFSYWGGDERGSDYQIANQDLPVSIPIATHLLHAAGIGFAMHSRREERAVLTTCGDGGTSEGDFYEALNFAGEFNLPVVFVVNNNQWAISVPRHQQTRAVTIAQKAIAAGFEGKQVDGNDIIAVRDAAANALEKARSGGGPTLIEAISYRLCDHTTADDARRYVDKAELEQAWREEPILRLRRYLESQQLWSEEQDKKLQEECTQKIAEAVRIYEQTPPQQPTAMLDYLFEQLPAAYQAQWDELNEAQPPLHT